GVRERAAHPEVKHPGRDGVSREARRRREPLGAGDALDPEGLAGRRAPGRSTAATGQFDIADDRSPEEIASLLRRLGYEPVWKDWDTVLSA
ncbi:MAG: hypothetical protein ACKPGI_19390, partial [Verrucomicrobiota bacterium]